MNKNDFILVEICRVIKHPDEEVVFARKNNPIKWLVGITLFTILGILQALLWVITVIPTIINKWVLDWRYV